MGKLDLKLMKGIEEVEEQFRKDQREQNLHAGLSEEEKTAGGTADGAGKPGYSIRQNEPEAPVLTGEDASGKACQKPRKQVFSFRAFVSDIILWKAYAAATGEAMESIGASAMNEYLSNHQMTAAEQAIFKAIKAKNTDI